MIPFSSILHHNMGMKCAEDHFNMGMFFIKVLHNGCIFRPPTNTSGHFILESPTPPGPRGKVKIKIDIGKNGPRSE